MNPNTVLSKIQQASTDFSQAFMLASKIYVRVPMSQDQYKWVDANYSITSPSFDHALYLTTNDIEYYNYSGIWVLSPNDMWGVVREFTRREDYIVDPVTNVIVDKQNNPWLKVAIGNPGNMTIFQQLIKYLAIATIAFDNISSLHYKTYLKERKNNIITYEFQGSPDERKLIEKLLGLLTKAYATAGPLAPSIREEMLKEFGHDTTMIVDYADILEIREGITVDEVYLLGPENGYTKIVSLNSDTDKHKLEQFQQSVTGKYAVIKNYAGPWFFVFTKMIDPIKRMITMYDAIAKQYKMDGGALPAATCDQLLERIQELIKYITYDENDVNVYDLAVELLKLRKSVFDPKTCLISAGDDALNSSIPALDHAALTTDIINSFNKGEISEMYVIPTDIAGVVINSNMTYFKRGDTLEINKKPIVPNCVDNTRVCNSDGTLNPWMVLYRDNVSGTQQIYKALLDSFNNLIKRTIGFAH